MKRKTSKIIKTYSELIRLKTFEERYEYLRLAAIIGDVTFGSERFLNQRFYASPEWREFRRKVIIRDECRDMGLKGYDIYGRAEIHHINPIGIEDVINRSEVLMDFENVICVSSATHKAIHYGQIETIPQEPIVRRPNDMCPWKIID